MELPKLKKERLEELENYGWIYDIMEAGFISPDLSAIAIDNRSPYQNKLLKFSHDEEKYKNTLIWLIENNFIEE